MTQLPCHIKIWLFIIPSASGVWLHKQNWCPKWETLEGMDYLPFLGSSGQVQLGEKRKPIFLARSCCAWNNPFSSHRLHFDKEEPKARQADPWRLWEPHWEEVHTPQSPRDSRWWQKHHVPLGKHGGMGSVGANTRFLRRHKCFLPKQVQPISSHTLIPSFPQRVFPTT